MSNGVASSFAAAVAAGRIPEEGLVASDLNGPTLTKLKNELRTAKAEAEDQAVQVSRVVANDVDGWISRARQVQADIQKSKATARSIIEHAEEHERLQANADDRGSKVSLLERELQFSQNLRDALASIQAVNNELQRSRDALVHNLYDQASTALDSTIVSLDEITTGNSTNVIRALRSRSESVKQDIVTGLAAYLHKCYKIKMDPAELDLSHSSETIGDCDAGRAVAILSRYGALETFVAEFSEELKGSLFAQWLIQGPVAAWKRAGKTDSLVRIDSESQTESTSEALDDLGLLVQAISEALPEQLSDRVAIAIMPGLLSSLEMVHLPHAMPLESGDLADLDQTMGAVKRLAGVLEKIRWTGSDALLQWTESVPKAWLARQREHVLDSVRIQLLENLKKRSQVTKTITVAPVDQHVGSEGKESSVEDDTSAWDAGAGQDDTPAKFKAPQDTDQHSDDDNAWDWDGEQNSAGANAVLAHTEGRSTGPRRPGNHDAEPIGQAYQVTGVPSALFGLVSGVFSRAATLTSGQYQSSTIAPAVPALNNIPPLAMALFRAMAVTAYDKIDGGKLLLHNDAIRLAELLRTLATNEPSDVPAASARKLDQESEAFDRFAQLAYGAEIDAQSTIIRDMMDSAQGFSRPTTSPYSEECDSAVSMTIDRIRDVSKQWQAILPQSDALRATGSLLAVAVTKFILDVEDMEDIGEDESRKLLSYCKSFSSLHDVFSVMDLQSGEARDMAASYCQNWLKLQYFGEILDGNLADIKYLWKEGELSMEFELDEILDLIVALFADSEHRRKAIAEIKASRR